MKARTLQSVLTPPGAGGIAVLAVSGPAGPGALMKLFHFGGRLRRFRSGRIHYGHITDGAQVVDEVIVTYLDPASSPTGEAYFEVNCHGGTVPVREVCRLLKGFDIEEVPWETFITCQERPRRAKIECEAHAAACLATTHLAMQHLFFQEQGALARALNELVEMLRRPRPDLSDIRGRAEGLLATARFGMALSSPPAVAVVGRPNVGKSTLTNALVGSERSLVHHLPGTTRDAVSSLACILGVPVRMVDTAGLRDSQDEVEAQGVRVSRANQASADLVMWVFDHSRPEDGPDQADLELLHGKRVVPVVNKMDLPGRLAEVPLTRAFTEQVVHTCALTGFGMDELKRRIIVDLFGPSLPQVGSPVVFSEGLREELSALMADLAPPDPNCHVLAHHADALAGWL